MSRVVVAEYVTLDGVMEDPGGVEGFAHGGWHNPDWNDELDAFQRDGLFASDALLPGVDNLRGAPRRLAVRD